LTPTFTPTPIPGGNLLANPGFESGSANWTGISGDASITFLVFHSGIQSVQINQPASGQKVVDQAVSVTAGQGYFASGWIRTNAITAGSAQIFVVWYPAGGPPAIRVDQVGMQLGTVNWTYYSANLTAPAGAAIARFSLGVIWRASGQGYFDDLVFRAQ
jgi:hypothetical protein